MVNVRVRHQHEINQCCIHGNLLILVDIRPLLHAAVDKDVLLSQPEIMTTSGHLMGGP